VMSAYRQGPAKRYLAAYFRLGLLREFLLKKQPKLFREWCADQGWCFTPLVATATGVHHEDSLRQVESALARPLTFGPGCAPGAGKAKGPLRPRAASRPRRVAAGAARRRRSLPVCKLCL
jgi:hypothetical protein